MIEAHDLGKRFGSRTAIEAVSLHVERGEIVGFLGPNGAGKTTTLRILAGVFPPTSGRAAVNGHDLATDPLAARRSLGYAPERPALYLDMTVGAQLEFVVAMRGVMRGSARRAAAHDALARTGLESYRDRRIGTLSRGLRQRVGVAVALVGDPPALLLDEPAAGLDPGQSAELRRLVRALGRDHAIFVSSHVLADMEALCDRVVILHRGRVLAADTPGAIAARLRPAHRVDVEARAPGAALAAALGAVEGVVGTTLLVDADGRARCRVEAAAGVDCRPALAAAVARAGWELLALAPVEPRLEEAFLAITSAAEPPA